MSGKGIFRECRERGCIVIEGDPAKCPVNELDCRGTVAGLAHSIFDRVDWTWLSEDTTLLAHGWTPEFGFIPSRWDFYSELMMRYLLGMGSSSHPLNREAWFAWKRTKFEYDGLRYIGLFASLFVHQYSQAWFDFRNKRDRYADYFQNSIVATDAHRIFCLGLNVQFPDYSNALWGITASDSERGYVIWGGPPAMRPIDGSIVPAATGGLVAISARRNHARSPEEIAYAAEKSLASGVVAKLQGGYDQMPGKALRGRSGPFRRRMAKDGAGSCLSS
jgi:Putative glucoamylase